jgi:hypothetical protein
MAIIKGNSRGIVWGTTGVGGPFAGICTSARRRKSGTETEIQDEDGDIAAVILHAGRTEVELEVIANTADALPEYGDDITIAGVTGTVVSAEETFARAKEKVLRVSAKDWGFAEPAPAPEA